MFAPWYLLAMLQISCRMRESFSPLLFQDVLSNSLDFCSKNSPKTRSGSSGLSERMMSVSFYRSEIGKKTFDSSDTHWSFASNFMPSRSAPVTFVFRYRRVESPWGGASDGIEKPGSGCAEAALEPCAGVPVRPGGAGLGAKAAGAGDYII